MTAFCPKRSKIKMVANPIPPFEKVVWYSYLDQNKKPDAKIINGMIERFKTFAEYNTTRVLQFYDNLENKLIEQKRLK